MSDPEHLQHRVAELERQVRALLDAEQRAQTYVRTELMRTDNDITQLRWKLNYLLAGLEALTKNVANRGETPAGRGRHF